MLPKDFYLLISCFILYSVRIVRCFFNDASLKVVIDADPGVDDAMAIMMMLSSLSKAEVVAITTATGNTGAKNGTQNALLTLKIANRMDIPVYTGSEEGLAFYDKPMYFFGYDGFGDKFKNKPIGKEKTHAAVALADIARQQAGTVTVLVTGPLTNIALALHINPRFLEDIKNIVILGGSYQGGGNKKPGVEFNIGADPEAAAFVFSKIPSGKPVILVPMETPLREEISMNWRLNVLGKIDNCIIEFFNSAEEVSLKKEGSTWFAFDQTAAAVLLEPGVVLETEDKFIHIETCGRLARGAVFIDDSSEKINARIITKINKSKFKETLVNYLNSSSKDCIDIKVETL